MKSKKNFKIYCAGPLFNDKEKEEMAEIAAVLEQSGFRVFLPHRDGFEFAHLSHVFKEIGVSEAKANRLLNKAIFTLDVYQVLNSDGLVLNINGRVPDEGATVEAGIAWNAGKQVVIYKNDARTLLNGTDNPLLLGLSDFNTIETISKIPSVFHESLTKYTIDNKKLIDNSRLQTLYQKGRIVARLAVNGGDKIEICQELIKILGDN